MEAVKANVTAEGIGNVQITHVLHAVLFAWAPMIRCHTARFVLQTLIILKLEDQAEDAIVRILTTMVGIDLLAFLVIQAISAHVLSIVNTVPQAHVMDANGAEVFV